MKRLLFVGLLLLHGAAFALQTAPAPMPPEDTKPDSYTWWIVGVVIAIAAGVGLYFLIKKDPRKDVQ